MNLIFHIGEGLGLAAAAGIRPFLPAVLAGALATGDVVVDFDRTDYSFLESPAFLIAMAIVLALAAVAQRRLGADVFASGPLGAALAGIGVGLGALLFAAVLAQHHDASWPGLIAGAGTALLAQVPMRGFADRVRSRLGDGGAREAVTLYLDLASLALAAIAIFAPPASYVALAFLIWMLAAERRRRGEKHAGLRVLR
jgi:hypothetical protein